MTGAWIVVVALCIVVGLLAALTISLGGPAGMIKLARDIEHLTARGDRLNAESREQHAGAGECDDKTCAVCVELKSRHKALKTEIMATVPMVALVIGAIAYWCRWFVHGRQKS